MSSFNSENSRPSAEVEHLNRLEAIVRRGLDADLEVGSALAEINDTWLYRASHETFEAYVRDRWGMSPALAQELIEAAEAAEAAGRRSAASQQPTAPLPSPARGLVPARRDDADRFSNIWEKARQEFGGDDVAAVEIHLTVHKRPRPPALEPKPWSSAEAPDELAGADLLRWLRWLMTESSGTIANIAYQLETHAAELDDDACEQLRDDVVVLDEDLSALKALLPGPVDWDVEHGRLIAGEVPPFEDDPGEDDDD
ncbi:MAG TPA: hypothetical protein VMF14_04990 [Solirubrobacteraceae bacterium]|nr:hypothetical protein [Solirubrobacteraceae bacterium]